MKATAQKNSRMPTLTSTIAVLIQALSLAPRTSSTMARTTITIAGTLSTPPSPGGAAIASGRTAPKTARASLTYWPAPTATAATETAYSSTRHQPQIQAMPSPMVA